MTLPASGSLSMGQVNVELGAATATQRSLGSAAVRGLYGVPSGAIRLAADGYGKSSVIPRQLIFLTSGSSWTVPANWTNSINTIECIGGGSAGQSTANGERGGGGGAYSRLDNVTLTPGAVIPIAIGNGGTNSGGGGDTTFNGSMVVAKGGQPLNGGDQAAGVGSIKYSGGGGGSGNSLSQKPGGGGGGAAGRFGPGGTGGSSPSNGLTYGPGGGGGGGGATAASNPASGVALAGGTGANASGQVAGTAGAAGSGNGSASNGSSGGGGGGGNPNAVAGFGGAGLEFGSGRGSGGGGGACSGSGTGGTAGLYGGGGGGGFNSGPGAQGIIVIGYGGAPADPTKLLMHFDTATGFADSSLMNRGVATANGTVTISGAQKKFGDASALFNNSNLLFPDSPDWAFPGDFTIDMWVWLNAYNAGNTYFVTQLSGDTDYNNRWAARLNAAGLMRFDHIVGGTTYIANVTVTPVPLSAWTHLAWVRAGGNFNFYLNGVLDGTTPLTQAIPDISGQLSIGRIADATANSAVNGYIDELRISNGIARWTGNFTPPAAPY